MAERVKTVRRHLDPIRNPAVDLAPTSGLQAASVGDFQFSTDKGAFTPEQRQFYETNGFVIIRNLVPRDKLAKYRKRFQDICLGIDPVPGMTVMRDVAIAKSEFKPGEAAITKIQDYQHDETLFEFPCLPEVVKYVRSAIGGDVMAMHTMLINKPPDPGTQSSRHPMHQDLHYFPFRPANKVVCAWTAMEHVHRDNGCLVVVPGTHTLDLLPHEYPKWEGGVNKMYHGIRDYDASKPRTWVEMHEGDTVFFHPLLLHGSGTNRTKGFRKAISCHYASSDCEWIDVKGSSQEVIADEVKELIVKRFGKEAADRVDYSDVWKLRARHVCGKEAGYF